MMALNLTHLQLTKTLFSGIPAGTSSSSGFTDLTDSIADQYMTRSLSSAGVTAALDGIYNNPVTMLQSQFGSKPNRLTTSLMSAGLISPESPSSSVVGDNGSGVTNKYELMLAANRAFIGASLSYFGGQGSSSGSIFDMLF